MGGTNSSSGGLQDMTFVAEGDLVQRACRIGPWLTCVALVLFNILVAAYENQYRHTVRADIRAAAIKEQEYYATRGSADVGDYLSNVLMEMRLIGQLLGRSGLEKMPRDTIETIAHHNVQRNWVTEIYVVGRDFTGEKEPLAAFEFDDDKIAGSVEEEHDLESEKDEYAEIRRQMEVYADQPGVKCQLSQTLNLCALKRGQVLTIPVKSEGKLVGLVAAMLPVKHMLKLAADGSLMPDPRQQPSPCPVCWSPPGRHRPGGRRQWWIVGTNGRLIGSPAGSFPQLENAAGRQANGRPNPTTIEKDGLVVSASATEVPGIGRLLVMTAMPGERLSQLASQGVGGPWSFRLLGALAIGNLVGLCLILLFRYWQKRSEHYRNQSERDSLTGLYSRHKLDQVLRTLAGDKAEMAALVIDLNFFKEVNDKLGHDTGDQLLEAVANLLRRCLRQADMAFRAGGDEFTVLLNETDQPTMNRVTTRIREAAAQWNLANRIPEARISLAIGGAIGPADQANSVIKKADARMYQDKAAYRR